MSARWRESVQVFLPKSTFSSFFEFVLKKRRTFDIIMLINFQKTVKKNPQIHWFLCIFVKRYIVLWAWSLSFTYFFLMLFFLCTFALLCVSSSFFVIKFYIVFWSFAFFSLAFWSAVLKYGHVGIASFFFLLVECMVISLFSFC